MIVLLQDGLLGDSTIVVYVLVFCDDALDWVFVLCVVGFYMI